MSDSADRDAPSRKERMEALVVEPIDRDILFAEALRQFEECFIHEVLRRHVGNALQAACELGIHRNALARRQAQYKKTRR